MLLRNPLMLRLSKYQTLLQNLSNNKDMMIMMVLVKQSLFLGMIDRLGMHA